jgi:hypothetical protein
MKTPIAGDLILQRAVARVQCGSRFDSRTSLNKGKKY